MAQKDGVQHRWRVEPVRHGSGRSVAARDARLPEPFLHHEQVGALPDHEGGGGVAEHPGVELRAFLGDDPIKIALPAVPASTRGVSRSPCR